MRIRLLALLAAILSLSSLQAQTDGDVDPAYQPVMRNRGQVVDLLAAPDGRYLITGGFTSFQNQPVPGGAWVSASGQFAGEFRRDPPPGFEDKPVAIFADGRVLALRSSTAPIETRPAPRLVRLQAGGATDPGFQSPALIDFWQALTLPDGKVLVRVRGSDAAPVATRAIFRLGTDGAVDPTFVPPTWLGDSGQAIARQSDGKILIRASLRSATGTERQGLSRLLPDGALDASFELVSSELLPGGPSDFSGNNFYADSILIRPDGSFYVVAAGSLLVRAGAPAKPALRFSASGSLDPSFVVTGYSGGFGAAALLPDGGLLGLNTLTTLNGGGLVVLVRLTPQGALDATFAGGAGSIVVSPFDPLPRLESWPGGGVVLGGGFSRFRGVNRNGLLALTSAGEVDATFAVGNGVESATATIGSAVRESASGGLWIAGSFTSVDDEPRRFLARLQGNGRLDASFAPTVALDGVASLQDDAAGGVYALATVIVDSTFQIGVVHLLNDGSLDPNFAPPAWLSPFNAASTGSVSSLVRQPDGKLLVGGYLPNPATGLDRQSRIVRLLANGAVESGFDILTDDVRNVLLAPSGRIHAGSKAFRPDGTVDPAFVIAPGTYPENREPGCVAIDSNGRLLVADRAQDTSDPAYRAYGGLRRFLTDGSVDATFRPPPRAFGTAHFQQFNALLTQPDGRVIAGGQFLSFGGRDRNSLVRLTAGGSLDLSFSAGTGVFVDAPLLDSTEPVGGFVALPSGNFLVYGSFRSFGGQPRPGLARILNSRRTVEPASGAGRLVNISTRAYVATGDQVMIAGFVIKGTGTRRLALRALGPSLAGFGVQNALLNPTLRLVDAAGATLATNDDWGSGNAAELTAAGLAPTDAREAGLVVTLGAGAYTVVASGVNATSGVALVEVYDLDASGTARVVNLSTRALTARPAGDGTLEPTIAGFAVRGGKVRTVLRGMGPSLAAAGVVAPLADPNLTTRLFNGSLLAFQSGSDSQPPTGYTSADLVTLGLEPARAEEAAIILDLPEGNYTSVMESGAFPSQPGVALIEVYDQEDAALGTSP